MHARGLPSELRKAEGGGELTSRAEDVLYLSLTDVDALETIAKRGLDTDLIPTVPMRDVVTWAIEQYFASGMTQAPSRTALLDTWGEVIDDARVELLPEDEEADTISWALDDLASQYVHWRFQQFTKDAATAMATAPPTDRTKVLSVVTDELFHLNTAIQPQHSETGLSDGVHTAMMQYEVEQIEGHHRRGMMTGLELIDDHTYGIREGELAIFAAGPKTGKSFALDLFAINEFERGRKVVLFTLENSVEMTILRMMTLRCGVSYRSLQRGECSEMELERVRVWMDRLANPEPGDGVLEVIMPEPGQRTVQAMVRRARMSGADSVFIDQLTFVEHANPGRKQRNEVLGEILHELKAMISSGPNQMSCMLAHQINRAGVEAAKKAGQLAMEFLAESSETERTADWVFGLHQSREQGRIGEATLQILAARRERNTAWTMTWEPFHGLVAAVEEVDLDED